MKRPAFQFYPADWRKDAALQSCSIAGRGLWHEMLCVMHECIPYGHLAINGVAIDDRAAARLCGVDVPEYRRLFSEIDRAGVPSRTRECVIFSRRMVKDERIRTVRAEAGKQGGNPILLKQMDNLPSNQSTEQKPTPSSSSSSSSKEPLELHGDGEPVDNSNPGDKSQGSKAKGKANGHHRKAGWWSTDEGVEAKGAELKLPARIGEARQAYKDRLFAAMNHRKGKSA